MNPSLILVLSLAGYAAVAAVIYGSIEGREEFNGIEPPTVTFWPFLIAFMLVIYVPYRLARRFR